MKLSKLFRLPMLERNLQTKHFFTLWPMDYNHLSLLQLLSLVELSLYITSRRTLAKLNNVCVYTISPAFLLLTLPELDGEVAVDEILLTKPKVC